MSLAQFDVSNLLIFGAFGVLAVGVAMVVVFSVVEWVTPVMERLLGGASPMSKLETGVQRLLPRHRQESGDKSDDLEDSTAVLLSLLPGASVVVNEDDEVVRASPSAYTLGVVIDDAIADGRVLDEIHRVREQGSRGHLDIETSTPWQYEHVLDATMGEQDKERRRQRSVTRPNWLSVTVGRINEQFVVVMIEDRSDVIRFSQTRDAFITNVSEQLLTPTQALMQLADSLEQGGDHSHIAEDARQVRAACGHLNRMVSDLLLLIKAQEPITPSAANMMTLDGPLSAVVESRQREASRRNIHVVLVGETGLQIHGDAEQIRTAVGKLIDNAVAYSPNGTTVTVAVRRSEDGEQAEIRVIDCGCGIPQREQTHVFERFYRGSNQNERTEDGVGLGLAIVKHVSLTHHGSASVWSRVGQGSTFSLTLPIAR